MISSFEPIAGNVLKPIIQRNSYLPCRIPLLAEEGRRDSLIEAGAPGAKREPDRAKPRLVVSSAEIFRRSSFKASPCRARASRHAVCACRRIHPCEEGNAYRGTPLLGFRI